MISEIMCKKTILIVDDAVENLLVLDEVLKKDYRVICSQSGEEALNILRFETPDLILLDIVMPYLNGYETCKKVKKNIITNKIPIIFLSSNSDDKDKIKGFECGAIDYIVKPVNPLILIAKLKAHIKEAQRTEDLEQLVQEKANELDLARLEIIQKLELATEYRNADTGDHINRMSRYSYTIAKEYGFSDNKAKMLLHASAMHDVGKIGIPDSILLKPGKLNDNEWNIMTKHPEIGAKIINRHSSELLDLAYIVAYQHHEKWNGEGYPRGLKGEEININARIAAVADVFDALTSDRPYRKAWDIYLAIDYINDESGKQFDPSVVDAFNKVSDKIIFIKQTYENQTKAHDIIDCFINEL